jgi:hypothetical protein
MFAFYFGYRSRDTALVRFGVLTQKVEYLPKLESDFNSLAAMMLIGTKANLLSKPQVNVPDALSFCMSPVLNRHRWRLA